MLTLGMKLFKETNISSINFLSGCFRALPFYIYWVIINFRRNRRVNNITDSINVSEYQTGDHVNDEIESRNDAAPEINPREKKFVMKFFVVFKDLTKKLVRG